MDNVQDLVMWLGDKLAEDATSHSDSFVTDVAYLKLGTGLLIDTGGRVFRVDVSEVGK